MKRINFDLRIEHLWGLVALAGIFIFVSTHPIRPQDFWWHIAVGREITSTGHIPTVDIYSYTEAGQPYPSYQMFWLMEVTLFELYHLGGAALVVFVHSLIVTAAYCIIFWLCLRSSTSWRVAAFGVLFAAALGLNDWNVRPQGITFLLASLILLAIFKYKEKNRWPWLILIPACMLVWVNSHGTFFIGLVLIAIWWGQRLWDVFFERVRGRPISAIKPLVVPGIVLIISGLICLINPRGPGIVDYIKSLTSNSIIQSLVTEWAPPSFRTSLGIIFFCCLIASAILLALSLRRLDFYKIALFIIFGALAIRTSRGIVWFGLVMAPIVAEMASALINHLRKPQVIPKVNEGSKVVNYVFAVVILLMGVITLPWFKSRLPFPAAKAGLISSETPVEATKILLDQNPPGRLFNSMSFGSFLIWAAYPKYQVFVDTRIELYSENIWLDYLNISNAYGEWESTIDKYGVNTLMLSPDEQAPLISTLASSLTWRQIYQDNSAVIYTRIK